MIAVTDFVAQIRRLKRNGLPFYTNLYARPSELETILLKEHTRVYCKENILLVFEEDNGFFRLHYWASGREDSVKEFCNVLEICPIKKVVADIVSNSPLEATEITDLFLDNGFQHIETLVRMRSNSEKNGLFTCGEVKFAELIDVDEIERLLYSVFDPRISRLPDKENLVDRIQKREILVTYCDGFISSVAIIKRAPASKVLLEQLLTNPNYRNCGFASKLVESVIQKYGIDRQVYLWANTVRQNAVGFYEAHGFRQDGLSDYILFYDKERDNGKNLSDIN